MSKKGPDRIELAGWRNWDKILDWQDFPRYNMKCSGEDKILRGIFHVVSIPLHFMLYWGNLD